MLPINRSFASNAFLKKETYKEKCRRTFDRWAKTYDRSPRVTWFFGAEKWFEMLRREMTNIEGSSFIDLGCGTGRILTMLADHRPALIAGLDISAACLEQAREKLKAKGVKFDLRVGDAEAIPWPSETFDYVIATGAFEYFTEPIKVISESYRVLKENGWLIIIEPDYPAIIRNLYNLLLRFTPLDGHYHLYSGRELKGLVASSGFEEISVRRDNLLSVLVKGRKRQIKRR